MFARLGLAKKMAIGFASICSASVGLGETRRLSYTYRVVPDGGIFDAETATEFQRGREDGHFA